ncbi:cyclin d4;2 [Actinidia rufa]|uniref:Cyclin d42 n=1 Tax=Actinidia rufa TaxID=165716 RepID=A0A7J0DPB4_9ERIC|nr:cyclin d4;2 [Actinidia rufa]
MFDPMADISFDCSASNLLCTESNNLCFDDLDSVTTDDQTHESNNQNLGFVSDRSGPLIGLPLLSEESFCLMIERERQHLPRDDYLKRLRSGGLDLSVRREALDWICKAHAHYNFGPLSVWLSMNYLDRFLSVYELPKGKTWTVQLLAVACLSLATKMEETTMPLTIDLQVGELKFVFEGIDFLEFRPSEIAAAVAISVSVEMQAVGIHKAGSSFIHIEKGRVLKCLELIQDLALISGTSNVASAASVPQSPIGVLDAACLSYKTDELTVGSYANSSHSSPDTKRRKLDTPSQEHLKS